MRRGSIFSVSTLLAIAMYGCGPQPPVATDPSSQAASGDVCPAVSEGPPPVCPKGCAWNGTECRQQAGIIMEDVRRPPTK